MKHLALLLAPLMLVACTSTPTVTTDIAPGANFSNYHSYTWGAKPSARSPLASQRIVADIDARLKSQGWIESANADADITLVGHVAHSKKHRVDTYYSGGPYAGWGWHSGGMMGNSQTTVSSYDVGTLIVDMFDTKTKQAIWRGTASTTVPSSTEAANAKIDAGIAKMFTGFPTNSQ